LSNKKFNSWFKLIQIEYPLYAMLGTRNVSDCGIFVCTGYLEDGTEV
jgi:Ulp1 family protease